MMVKKILSGILVGGLLIQLLIISAFAADLTLTLSADSGYAGNNITVSGSCAPNEWITVKALDLSGNIVYIQPVLSKDDGTFSTDFIVPGIDAGTITLTAGSGSNVATADFTVKVSHSSNSTDNDKDEITNPHGTTITGTVEEKKNGCDITIDGDDFRAVSGGSVVIDAQFAEVTFDQKAAEYISHAAGSGSVVLSIANVDKSALSDEARKIVGDRPAYEISISAGGTNISTLGDGLAYVSIPYTLAEGEDPNAIVAYYINADGEPELMQNCYYDGATGMLAFTTTHFSSYAVGYNKVPFSDVSDNVWYADAVSFLAAREITSGTTDTTFEPDAALTRGQFMTLVMRAYGIDPDDSSAANFSDAGNTYYTGYLAAAKSLSITNGIGDNNFAPEQAITRQEMFTLLDNTLKAIDRLPQGDSGKTLSDFTDSGSIASYAKEATACLVETGVISGSNGLLNPTSATTRAQMAQVLYNLLGNQSIHN